jgi:Threonyl and Alanyl tRNA synthetase second additional domain
VQIDCGDCRRLGERFFCAIFSLLLVLLSLSVCTDAPVEAHVNKIIKEKQKFERMVITKVEGLELFADNPFKVSILQTKVPDGGRTTVYRCGDLIDLCRGPHLSHTGKVKAFAATRHSATNWLGDTDNESLQRLYGISFPDKKMLKIWQENQEKVRATGEGADVKTEAVMIQTNLILGKIVTTHSNPLILLSFLVLRRSMLALCRSLTNFCFDCPKSSRRRKNGIIAALQRSKS